METGDRLLKVLPQGILQGVGSEFVSGLSEGWGFGILFEAEQSPL